jgi:hypothetical protein
MDRNAYRDDNDTDQPDAYWRRRVITLVAGLALLGVLAWAFSGSGGKTPRPVAKASSPGTTITPEAAYGSASSTPPFLASPSASAGGAAGALGGGLSGQAAGLPRPAVGSGAGTGSSQASGKRGTGKTPGSRPATKAATKAPASVPSQASVLPGGGCAPSAVVLSLFTSRPEYSGKQDPQFSIYAVSTASQACTFAVSPGKLQVIVMSAGRIIWDSTDCAKGLSTQSQKLKRGVPVQESVTWNRSVSLPGCVTLASSARVGTYQVQARSGGVSSPVRTFKLERLTTPALTWPALIWSALTTSVPTTSVPTTSVPTKSGGAQNGGEGLPDVLHLLHLDVVGQALRALQGPA